MNRYLYKMWKIILLLKNVFTTIDTFFLWSTDMLQRVVSDADDTRVVGASVYMKV